MKSILTRVAFAAVAVAVVVSPAARGDVAIIGEGIAHAGASVVQSTEHTSSTPAQTTPDRASVSLPATTATTTKAATRKHAAAKVAKGQYKITLRNNDGTPVRWDSCAPIHVQVNLTEAPAGAMDVVRSAVATLSKATGLHYIIDGTTSTAPTTAFLQTVERDGTASGAPLLIGWAHRSESDILSSSGELAGETSTTWLPTTNGEQEYVGAVVVLNSDENSTYSMGFGANMKWGTVLLHELGHSVGLDHVTDKGDIMYPVVGANAFAYGPGDKAGLALEGRGGCLTLSN